MAMIEYTLEENVAIVTLNSGENRLNPGFIQAFFDVLDTVEKETRARTLVVTSAHEKIFSNGIDLEWLMPVIQKGDTDTAKNFLYAEPAAEKNPYLSDAHCCSHKRPYICRGCALVLCL